MGAHGQRPDIPLLDVVAEAGLTYRQVDYWIRKGAIRLQLSSPGSGTCRDLTPKEAELIIRFGQAYRAAERRLDYLRSGGWWDEMSQVHDELHLS